MSRLWDAWDRDVKQTGNPKRVAEALSDPELLAMLAEERGGRREVEKRILRDEALARLEKAQRAARPSGAGPDALPPAGP